MDKIFQTESVKEVHLIDLKMRMRSISSVNQVKHQNVVTRDTLEHIHSSKKLCLFELHKGVFEETLDFKV